MKSAKYFSAFLILIVIFIAACSKTDEEDRTFDSEKYYRYKAGNIRDYYLDSTAYDNGTGTVKTYHFLIHEIVTDSFTDLSGSPAMRIEQYISRDSGKNYFFYALHVVRNDNFGHQRVENNQRYLKISLPIVAKRTWNGNMFNNLGEYDFQYEKVFQPFKSARRNYSDCVLVTELNDSSIINEDKLVSGYLKDTGLAYKLEKHLKFYPQNKVGGYTMEWNLQRYWPK